ncbi:hypothetical protein CBOM_04880 [Ceraceosorus bombacis]|uniref:Uncharacterized protein n=1 Tax=Ceraceosorus bombacis TaxID=401625 RepID=A0A0P1BI02_9BASI|nr:hypothetical protein CBOM_04880 [Ceraceosorus bombacis]
MPPPPTLPPPIESVVVSIRQLSFVALVFLGIFWWELLIFLPSDYRILRHIFGGARKRAKVPLTAYLVLGMRWLTFGVTIPAADFFFGSEGNCDAMQRAMYALYAVVTVCVATLFGLRCWIIWQKSNVVAAILILVGGATVAAWAWTATLYRGQPNPLAQVSGVRCALMSDAGRKRAIAFGLETLYDCIVFSLTLWALVQRRVLSTSATKGSSAYRVRKSLLRSSAAYFGISFLLSIPIPIYFALSVIFASRLVYNSIEARLGESKDMFSTAERSTEKSSRSDAGGAVAGGGGGHRAARIAVPRGQANPYAASGTEHILELHESTSRAEHKPRSTFSLSGSAQPDNGSFDTSSRHGFVPPTDWHMSKDGPPALESHPPPTAHPTHTPPTRAGYDSPYETWTSEPHAR